ncbi:unnamed protein product, partial [Prorocentrum cordatum]
ALRRRAFEDFDEVIFRCFGVHGREFGSSVNGFQMTVSGLEFSSGPPFTPSPDSRGRSSCSRRPASAATERSRCPRRTRLGVPGAGVQEPRARRLRRCGPQAGRHSTGESGLCVVELVETARVPIVKCRWCAEAGGAAASQAPGSPREFEVDVSFCNEVAYYNSRLLRAYADLDQRVVRLCLLVKLWAKRRRINSPFEGTLSSCSPLW